MNKSAFFLKNIYLMFYAVHKAMQAQSVSYIHSSIILNNFINFLLTFVVTVMLEPIQQLQKGNKGSPVYLRAN